MEPFNYYEYLNSISFHPPVMIITTLIFFYIRRKFLLNGKNIEIISFHLTFKSLNKSKIKYIKQVIKTNEYIDSI